MPARLLGGFLALVIHRRQLSVKLVFNLGNFALETTTAAVIYRTVLAGHSPFGGSRHPRRARRRARRQPRRRMRRRHGDLALRKPHTAANAHTGSRRAQVLAGLGNTSLALLAAIVVVREPAAAWLLVAICALAFGGFRGHASLRQRYAGLELLYGFTKSVGGSLPTEEVLTVLLGQAADLLRAEVSQIMLLGEDEGRGTVSELGGNGRLVSNGVSLRNPTSASRCERCELRRRCWPREHPRTTTWSGASPPEATRTRW